MIFPAPSIRRWSPAALAVLACSLAGCIEERPRDDALRIATAWPRAETSAIAREFADWLRTQPDAVSVDAASIAWIESPEQGPIDADARQPDLLLGGPIGAYARLAAEGALASLSDGSPRPYWVVARRSAVDLPHATASSSRLVLADPRVDPATRAWCLQGEGSEPWRTRYAHLVGLYGETSAPAGWRSGSARAAVRRGRADRTVVSEDSPTATSAEWLEGAAIPVDARRPRAARAFLNFLIERRQGEAGPRFEAASMARAGADAEDLAADLLGATLVDAQEELRIAAAAVRDAGSPTWAVDLLTQPPPWPPASVDKLLRKEGEAGPALVETLIGQVAPAPSLRLWLAQSWLKPRRALDREILADVAEADGGRLAREPRFRSWLRAEWTQWARQRYRWVARLAASGAAPVVPPPLPSDS
ncbi:hypothetical protein [Paludisphaera soli]|uniref:hypothetical protein n=1 Tax=Paludisphaera soli TaxID=2712865 RepID=UPI0013EB5AEC|nr:hypothetical protein [Paludisphaera soli]